LNSPSPGSSANGINASGQVVGSSQITSTESHAFLFANGVMQDLGTFGGTSSGAIAINNHGQIAGTVLFGTGPNEPTEVFVDTA
jgi:probable HAF family extracellular repeat protein